MLNSSSQKRVEREEMSKQEAIVAAEIEGIKIQYEQHKSTVLKHLVDAIVDVRLEVPAVVKAKFNVQQPIEDWNDQEVM